jgi:hypothetical protein
MTAEKQIGKLIEVPEPPLFLQQRTRGLGASVIQMDSASSAELVRLVGGPPSQEATRQMIQNIAGFFSQVADWDRREEEHRRQTAERKAA